MSDIREALAEHSFFAGLRPEHLDTVASLATWSDHPAGEWIERTGGDADRFHAVISGRVGIEITAADREPLVVATGHAGEVVGWSWFIERHPWHFDVIALDDVRTLALDAARLREACEADHELGYEVARRLLRVVASRLEATRHQLVDVYGRAR